MAKKLSDLRAQVSPETQTRIEIKTQKLLAEISLNELCQARGLSQKMLSKMLQVQQPAVARMERRMDMCVPALRSHIEAMGGYLGVIVRFPDGTVGIGSLVDIEEAGA